MLVYLLLFVFVCLIDCDLRLKFYDKFGGKVAQLHGKVIWITGASTGIGKALAFDAAKLGARIIISARSEQLLRDVKAKCLELGRFHRLGDDDILVLPLDMTDFTSHNSAVRKVIREFGRIDYLVHNAGRSQRARWDHTDLDVDRDLFDLNVFAPVNLSRLVMPHFHAQSNGGTFVIVSSLAGRFGVPFSGTYTGSKHAINGYFDSLRTEKVGTNIRVCIMCPGPVFSNLLSIAHTERAGETLGQSMRSTDKRMTAERCARLILVGAANGLNESWIANFPILPIFYATQYFPGLTSSIIEWIGPKFMLRLRDSREDTVRTS